MTMDLSQLAAEFPREAIHWRAQTVTKNGDKALALAYLDARDVQDRFDEVCGPAGWQCRYTETIKGRVLCDIGVKVGDEWIWKGDGSGDTDIEGEKGGISSAFKRAAVPWGVGRYLYRLQSPWVPCETFNGKWKKWTADPWNFVRGNSAPSQQAEKPKEEPFDSAATRDRIKKAIDHAANMESLDKLWNHPKTGETLVKLDEPHRAELQRAYNERAAQVFQAPAETEEA